MSSRPITGCVLPRDTPMSFSVPRPMLGRGMEFAFFFGLIVGTLGFTRPTHAGPPTRRPAAERQSPTSASASTVVQAGNPNLLAARGLRVVNNVVVDHTADGDTELHRRTSGGVASTCNPPNCSFDIECNDNDPCTVDRCDIAAASAPCSGTCLLDPVPDGASGECDDGLFCNGFETCEDGACVAGVPPQCCDDFELTFCEEYTARCSADSENAGALCEHDGDCDGGTCERCQPACVNDADCNDGANCNGVERCVADRCVPGQNPCGQGATCFEGDCADDAGFNDPCNVDEECDAPVLPGDCDRSAAMCAPGRCCLPFTDDSGEAQPVCTHKTLADCADDSPGSQWYAGDDGSTVVQEQNLACGGYDPGTPAVDAWGCPKYGRGITQHDGNTQPVYRVTIGQVSNSPAPVAAPNGPNGVLYAIGDDYTLANGSYIGLDVLRWVGGVLNAGRLVVEFRDATGELVADAVTPTMNGGIGIQLIRFLPSVTIPSSGYVVLRPATYFTPNVQFVWLSTTTDNGVQGSNNAEQLWVNGGAMDATWLSSPQILALELVGDKETAPAGACCNRLSGECVDGVLSWTCRNEGSSFRRGSTCVDFTACTMGACCDPVTGTCTESDQAGCSGSFLGFGTTCDADGGYDPAPQNCCPQPTSIRCMSGPNNSQACAADTDCGRCIGRCSNDGETQCGADGDCPSGTCVAAMLGQPCGDDAACSTAVENGACTNGHCAGGLRDGGDCGSDVDCQGTVCDGRCVLRGSGADDCEDAVPLIITVPNPGEPPKTLTISGDNSPASATFAHPDGCFGANRTFLADPGWWEGFDIADCANVRIDLCCTDPMARAANDFLLLAPALPSETPVVIRSSASPYSAGALASGFGPPYCTDGNFWATFPLLEAGQYWYPVYSVPVAARGAYQMHVTVEACPLAACCYLECSTTAQHCSRDTDCPGGETCDTKCDELNQTQCDAKLGFSVQPPQAYGSNVAFMCTSGLCDTGSCCTGPGECKDMRDNNGNPITKAVCESANFNGSFVGGAECVGGLCAGGTGMLPCGDSSECPPGDTCMGTPEELAQPNPCPVCDIQGPANCQQPQSGDNAQVAYSDRSFGAGLAVADDFLHSGGDITTVCVWGEYRYLDPNQATTSDCADRVAADDFRIRIMADANGIPGGIVAERSGTQIMVTRALTDLDLEGPEVRDIYGYQLALNPSISGLSPNGCYWLELTNNTPDSPTTELCEWGWLRLDENSSAGNRYAAAGNALNGYSPGSEFHWDQAFCLNTDFAPGGCGVRQRACCACGQTCILTDLETCSNADSNWQVESDTCGWPFECPDLPTNDDCAGAEAIQVGTYGVNTSCATTGGPNPIVTELATTPIEDDLWYFFTVSSNLPEAQCELMVSLCGTGNTQDGSASFDTLIAVYRDPDNPKVCPCPANASEQEYFRVGINGAAPGWAVDENCYRPPAGGSGFGLIPGAQPGECYTIRVGGYVGDDYVGTGLLDISCGPVFCGDGRRNGTEQCDGLDTGICGSNVCCNPNCTCMGAELCGDGIITLPYEECDPNASPTGCVPPSTCNFSGGLCSGCRCSPFCGNDHVETTEDCDGIDDDQCPGLCGPPGGDPADDCKCPPRVCGNGILDPGEECEMDADCFGGGACRAPGDPIGECTCTCHCDAPSTLPVWDCAGGLGNANCQARTRALTFRVVPPATATSCVGVGREAIRVTMVDLDNPAPAPPPCCVPQNFSAFGDATCTGDPAGPQSCSRWVGPPFTYPEAQDLPGFGNYRASRLQCTPYYHDWSSEPGQTVNVIAAEILPSSRYSVRTYSEDCQGAEGSCANISPDVTMMTRRAGDIAAVFQDPGGSLSQPNAIDIVGAVNNFKKAVGAPKHLEAQVQPNLPNLNRDVDALDIQAIVANQKLGAYPYSGPCPCPSTVTCNATICSATTPCPGSNLCMQTCSAGPRMGELCTSNKHCGMCVGGTRDGIPCDNNGQCDGGTCTTGTCNTQGFCRDRCGRCN